MATTQSFKTYERGTRVQTSNLKFGSGMYFTDAPLSEGYSRLLLNFDFNTDDITLVPRRGLQNVRNITDIRISGGTHETFEYTDGMFLCAANKVMHDSKEYEQYIVGRPDYDENYKTYKTTGDAWVITYPVVIDGEICAIAYKLNADTNTKVFFRTPVVNNTSIHDLQVSKILPEAMAIVGTFAYNGDFYFFTEDSQLRHTSWSTEEDFSYYKAEVVEPYKPTANEAMGGLYNALRADMYDYVCNTNASYGFTPTGFLPYKNGKLVLRPNINEAYDYRLTYDTNNTEESYYAAIEWTNGVDGVWHRIASQENALYVTNGEPFEFKNIKLDNTSAATLRVWLVPVPEDEEVQETYFNEAGQLTDSALLRGMQVSQTCNYISRAQDDATSNLDLAYYDLSRCKAMVYWKNRLFCIGAAIRDTDHYEHNVLIASEPNRPDWFAYPVNADTFDEEIIYAQPMLDNLLVFTHRNLYQLTLAQDGMSWTRQHLQSDLRLESWDLNLIKIVKNMVFFKSGNYYYMVVPKLTTSSGSGLSIAPVSNTIKQFFDKFSINVRNTIDDLYNFGCYQRYGARSLYRYSFELVHYYNYLDYEDMHNVYVLRTSKINQSDESETTVLLHYDLIYNTVSRTWRIYIVENNNVLLPTFANATGSGTFGMITTNGINLYEYSDSSNKDYIYKDTLPKLFSNWQLLDTGNMEQNSEMKKRYREYQFRINNVDNKFLEYYTGFYIDREARTEEIAFEEVEVSDSENPELQDVLIDAHPLPRGTESYSDATYYYTRLGSWKLGVSRFPRINAYKVRIPTSGKGYLPRIKLLSYNSEPFELLGISTVYRQMYSR